MEKIKFVMTDTDPQVSALCRHVLEEKGVSVTVCEKNGAKALEALLTIHPQAVLLDAFMPEMDAITVKQRYEAQNTSSIRTTFFVTGPSRVRRSSRSCWTADFRSSSSSRLTRPCWSAVC